MGYRRSLDVHEMVFEAGDLAGLTISVRELSAGETLALAAFDVTDPRPAIKLFVSKVAGWNLEDDDGRRVRITRKGFMGCDLDFVESVLQAWRTHVIPLPHGQNKPSQYTEPALPAAVDNADDDERDLVASLPMHALPDPAEEPDVVEPVADAVGV